MSREYEEMQVEKWVNLEDVAEHLSISQDTVRTWIKEGKLPVYRAGKRYKFKIRLSDLQQRRKRTGDSFWNYGKTGSGALHGGCSENTSGRTGK